MRYGFDHLVACLYDSSEEWIQGKFTLRNEKRDIDIWTEGGFFFYDTHPIEMHTSLREKWILSRAIAAAGRNQIARKCLA